MTEPQERTGNLHGKGRYTKFVPSKRQLKYLTSMDTFRDQAGLTLGERAALFNRKFKTQVMSVHILRRIYQENLIRKKKIRLTKEWTPKDPATKEERWAERTRDLERMKRENYDLVYVDEVMFTKHVFET